MTEKSLQELDLNALTKRKFTPSPAAWEDQVLYFLMLDRFSDGHEQGYRGNSGQIVSGGTTPFFQAGDAGNAVQSEASTCRAGGYASDGRQAILDTQPNPHHQRAPFLIGSRELAEKADEFFSRYN